MGNWEQFGEVRYIFKRTGTWGGWEALMANYDREYHHMEVSLKRFRPERDFFLPVGEQVPSMVAAAYLGAKFGSFAMLVWDARSGAYQPLEVTVGDYSDDDTPDSEGSAGPGRGAGGVAEGDGQGDPRGTRSSAAR